MGRFVKPDIVRLKLSDGDYLDVKKQLTIAEQRRIFAGMVRDMTPGEKILLDPEQVGRTQILEYVIGWGGPGFTDNEGRPVEYSAGALDTLDTESYNELFAAVTDHIAAQDAARAAVKNSKDGASSSSATSPSVG